MPKSTLFCVLAALVALSLLSHASRAATWQITYPKPQNAQDKRHQYPLELLRLALEQTGVRYDLQATQDAVSESRALLQLRQNRVLNVVWAMTDRQREQELLPIRIPIFKGLIGWRVFLINQHAHHHFKLDSLSALRKLPVIQGKDWPDSKILQGNGFSVVSVGEYAAMFNRLRRTENGYFARSLIEVLPELAAPALGKNLLIQPDLGIRYPAAVYFFVNQQNKVLAALIEDGLERAITNGQFDALFQQTFAQTLQTLQVSQRRFFELENLLLPENTPLSRKALWYQIQQPQILE